MQRPNCITPLSAACRRLTKFEYYAGRCSIPLRKKRASAKLRGICRARHILAPLQPAAMTRPVRSASLPSSAGTPPCTDDPSAKAFLPTLIQQLGFNMVNCAFGWAGRRIRGDHEEAQGIGSRLGANSNRFAKTARKFWPDWRLALINLGLGDKIAAIALSERAMAVSRSIKTPGRPAPIEIFARVAAQGGDMIVPSPL